MSSLACRYWFRSPIVTWPSSPTVATTRCCAWLGDIGTIKTQKQLRTPTINECRRFMASLVVRPVTMCFMIYLIIRLSLTPLLIPGTHHIHSACPRSYSHYEPDII